MRKIQSTLLMPLLFNWFIVFAVPIFVMDVAIANPQPTWRSIFFNWFGQEPKDRGAGGNSGGRPIGNVCLITPTDNAQLWTTQPLLIWQGSYSVAGVRPKGNNSVTWEETNPIQSQVGKRLSYVSKALMPGKEYEWGFFADQNRRSSLKTVTFRILDGVQRATIAKDLQALESELKLQNASDDDIALQRTSYFVQRGLRADALQEIYSVKKPSTELKQVMQDIEKKICQSQG